MKWPEESQKIYWEILNNPLTKKVIVCPGGYSAEKMQTRNEWMVNVCNKIAAVWDGTPGGTANCVKYARKMKREIIEINPNGWRK